MFKWRARGVSAVFALLVGLSPTTGKGQETEIVMALPSLTLTFSSAFIAEDAGFYKAEGLKVTTRNIVGVGSPNAVLAGSAHFTIGTGPVFLRAAAQGQRFLAIANLIERPLVELVLRKDVADAAGITAQTSAADRAKALKGKTIGIQGVGSIVHAWERYVVNRGGLDVDKDVRIAPMDPPAMLPALDTKAIDGYATSMPFTTQAVMKGSAIMLASGAADAPELLPFAYGLLYTKPDTCKEKRDLCMRVARAYIAATRFINEKPDEAFALLRKRFARLDPDLLAAAWKAVAAAHPRDIRVTLPGLEHSQKVSLDARLLEPKDALTSYDGLYTDEFVR